MNAHRWHFVLGWGLLLGGFLIVLLDVLIVPGYVEKFTVRQSSYLSESVTRDQAIEAMRRVGRHWNDAHRLLLVPVLGMLAGGVLLGAARKR